MRGGSEWIPWFLVGSLALQFRIMLSLFSYEASNESQIHEYSVCQSQFFSLSARYIRDDVPSLTPVKTR